MVSAPHLLKEKTLYLELAAKKAELALLDHNILLLEALLSSAPVEETVAATEPEQPSV